MEKSNSDSSNVGSDRIYKTKIYTRKAVANYKQRSIDNGKYNARLEYFRERNYFKRKYYIDVDNMLECIQKNYIENN